MLDHRNKPQVCRYISKTCIRQRQHSGAVGSVAASQLHGFWFNPKLRLLPLRVCTVSLYVLLLSMWVSSHLSQITPVGGLATINWSSVRICMHGVLQWTGVSLRVYYQLSGLWRWMNDECTYGTKQVKRINIDKHNVIFSILQICKNSHWQFF